VWFEGVRGDDVDRDAQEIGQLPGETGEPDESDSAVEVDQQIDVAPGVILPRATLPNTRTLWAPRR
jgi:hypothetical protein